MEVGSQNTRAIEQGASIIGIKSGTSKSQLHRSRLKVRTVIDSPQTRERKAPECGLRPESRSMYGSSIS